MSVRIMTQVWEHAPYDGGALLVLLALADWSNDQGWSWPAIDTLAVKARLHTRQTQRVLRKLEKEEMVEIKTGGGRAKQNKYRVRLETLSKCRPLISETVTSETVKGDISDTKTPETVSPAPPDPSVNTDPSVKADPPSSARALRAALDVDRKRLFSYLGRKIQGRVPNPPQQAKDITWLLESGYTAEQCEACLDALATQDWRNTAVTWTTVRREIAQWLLKQPQSANGSNPSKPAQFWRPANWRELNLKPGDPRYKWKAEELA